MGPRSRKVAAAATVLGAGLVLSWPLRLKQAPVPPASEVTPAPPEPYIAAMPVVPELERDRSARDGVSALGVSAHAGSVESFSMDFPLPAEPAPPPAERIHVVHEGDNLERLARRYLGDDSRALEIFDLNREVLKNPHLLPIGIELRIPASKSAVND